MPLKDQSENVLKSKMVTFKAGIYIILYICWHLTLNANKIFINSIKFRLLL